MENINEFNDSDITSKACSDNTNDNKEQITKLEEELTNKLGFNNSDCDVFIFFLY